MEQLEFVRFRPLDYACSEAVNTLCTNLSFISRDKRKIMVTSCRPGEGKSFISMNIARTMAKLGHSVVLVDSDLRKSNIEARYGLNVLSGKGYGLAHFLAGMSEIDNSLYTTNIQNFCFIPIGYEVSNSLALLNTPRYGWLLDKLAKQFEYVFVDAPPVGTIIDGAEIAKSCNETILAVSYNKIPRDELQEVKQQIIQTGCEILGVVLNGVTFDSISSKKYYNKSYYSSHYGENYYGKSDGKNDKKDKKPRNTADSK